MIRVSCVTRFHRISIFFCFNELIFRKISENYETVEQFFLKNRTRLYPDLRRSSQ